MQIMDHSEKYGFLKHIHKFDTFLLNTVAFLSIGYIFLMIFELYAEKVSSTVGLIILIDSILCIIFLFEFFYFMLKAKDRSAYFKRYFLDFLSAMPFMLLLPVFPEIAFLNLFKIIRGMKSIIQITEFFSKKKISKGASIIVIFLFVLIYFAIIVVHFERNQNERFSTFQDGLWWAVSTITTVGYGDLVPVTLAGKIAAMCLMLFSIGLISGISAIFVSFLLTPLQKKMIAEEKKTLAEEKTIETGQEELFAEEAETRASEKKLEQNQENIITFEKDITKKLEKINGTLEQLSKKKLRKARTAKRTKKINSTHSKKKRHAKKTRKR